MYNHFIFLIISWPFFWKFLRNISDLKKGLGWGEGGEGVVRQIIDEHLFRCSLETLDRELYLLDLLVGLDQFHVVVLGGGEHQGHEEVLAYLFLDEPLQTVKKH